MPDPTPSQRRIVFWVIWFAILQGQVVTQFFAGGGIPKGADQGQPPILYIGIAAGLALLAMVIRFVVIPQIESVPKKLPAMIIGLAAAEAIGFFNLFMDLKDFPTTRLGFFITAVVCIVCFAPVYAQEREGPFR